MTDRERYNERVVKWYVPDDPAAPRYVMGCDSTSVRLACGHRHMKPEGFRFTWDVWMVCPTCIRDGGVK